MHLGCLFMTDTYFPFLNATVSQQDVSTFKDQMLTFNVFQIGLSHINGWIITILLNGIDVILDGNKRYRIHDILNL